jgi:hypothetical protein
MNKLIIDRVIESNSTEELVELLNIDFHDLIQAHAEKIMSEMTDEKLLDLI